MELGGREALGLRWMFFSRPPVVVLNVAARIVVGRDCAMFEDGWIGLLECGELS